MDCARDSKVSFGPCPPNEFAGRLRERKEFREILGNMKSRGRFIMVSGVRGSGKTSFLDWAECEIHNKLGDGQSVAIKKEFLDTPVVFITYRDLLQELLSRRHKLGRLRRILNEPHVRKAIEASLIILDKASSLTGMAGPGVGLGIDLAKQLLPREPVEDSQLPSSLLSVLSSLSDELTKSGDSHSLVVLLDDVQYSSEPDLHLPFESNIQHSSNQMSFFDRPNSSQLMIYYA